MSRSLCLALFAVWMLLPRAFAADYRSYSGCCDSSAAAPVNEQLFAAASDEDNILRLYNRDRGGLPLRTLDVSAFLGFDRKSEADIEGAARVGELLFWIGSHSRNSDGEPRPARHVLFATTVRGTGQGATLEPLGRPYRGLVAAMASEPLLAEFNLGASARRPGEAPGALNIEGLAPGPDDSLMIAFRNPVPAGRALLLPLANPREVIAGESAKFGPPLDLDLGGLGIRGLTRSGSTYLIVAGPAEGGGRHRLYRWDGDSESPREIPKVLPKGFQAEAILLMKDGATTVDLLSDDGGEKVGNKRCEELGEATRRAFRALRVGF